MTRLLLFAAAHPREGRLLALVEASLLAIWGVIGRASAHRSSDGLDWLRRIIARFVLSCCMAPRVRRHL